MHRAWLVLALAACGTGDDGDGDTAPATPVDPVPFGREAPDVETREIMLEQRSDGFSRNLTWMLVAPTIARDDDAPVVIMNHGEDWKPEDTFQLATHLASHGLFVAAPRWDSTTPRDDEGLVRDLQMFMRALREEPLVYGDVVADVSRFGLVGHGRGAKQAATVAARDERVAAVVLLGMDDVESETDPVDAVPFEIGGITIPVAQVGFGRATTGTPSCVSEGYEAVAPALPAGSLSVVMPTAGQLDIIDTCRAQGGSNCEVCEEGEDPGATLRLARGVATGWIAGHMMDEPGFLTWLTSEGPAEVMADVEIETK